MLPKDIKSLDNANKNKKIHQRFLKNLKAKKNKKIDEVFAKEHSKEFEKMDCLTCANCCKTTSPIFRDADIRRISKALKIKEIQFIEQFLYLDNEQDYVLQTSPCPFLEEDNKCSIYSIRPLACKEYPHTNRKNIYQIADITFKNTLICPAVSRIVSRINQSEKQ